MLVQAVHRCAIKFPETAGAVVHLLMDFLGDQNAAAAFDVAMFIREIAQTNVGLRESILAGFSITSTPFAPAACRHLPVDRRGVLPHRRAGEASLDAVKQSLGPTPFFQPPRRRTAAARGRTRTGSGENESDVGGPGRERARRRRSARRFWPMARTRRVRRGPESVAGVGGALNQVPNLRALILRGLLPRLRGGDDAHEARAAVRLGGEPGRGVSAARANALHAEVMLIIVCVTRLGKSKTLATPIDEDSADRLSLCLKTLSEPRSVDAEVWLRGCRGAFEELIAEKTAQQARSATPARTSNRGAGGRPHRHAPEIAEGAEPGGDRGRGGDGSAEGDGFNDAGSTRGEQVNQVLQPQPASDPVYAEACVTVPVRHRWTSPS